MKMKRILLSCLVLTVCLCGTTRVRAAEDPGDKFLEAYFLIQDGDTAEHNNDCVKASAKFSSAHEILDQIKTQNPDWNPHIIEFRTQYTEEHLAALKAKVVAPTTTEPQGATPAAKPEAPAITPPPVVLAPSGAPTPEATASNAMPLAATAPTPKIVSFAPAAPVPPAENEQVKQLNAELERARQQIQQLQSARDELNTKLQEQLSKVAPTQTNQQIEDLLKTNQVLAAQLAAAQTEAAEARERAAHVSPTASTPPPTVPTPPAESPELLQLRTELAQARGELQQTKEQLQETRVELDTTKQSLEKAQADNAELRHSNDAVIAQLTDANKRLASAKASGGKDDEIIRQLRKENALLRIIAERKASASFVGGESEESTNGPAIPELRGWRPRQHPTALAKEQSKPEAAATTPSASALEESGRGKLVATLTSPKKVETPPAPAAVPPANTQTNIPPKPVVTVKKTPPPTPAPAAPKPSPTPAPKPAASRTVTNAPAPASTPAPAPAPKKPTLKPPAAQTVTNAPAPASAPAPAPAPKPAAAATPTPAPKPVAARIVTNAPALASATAASSQQPLPQQTSVTATPPSLPAPVVVAAPPPPPPPAPNERRLLNEARAALALKEFDRAGIKYTTVLDIDPTNLVALSSLGAIRYQQKQYDEAEDYLRKAVAEAPNDAETRSLLGVVFYRKGLTEDSFNELTRAVALDPHNAEAHNYLGIVLSQKGWGAAGEQEIHRAIEINPQYADAHFNLAIIYAKQHTPSVELAKYHYKKALDLGAPPDAQLEALLKRLSDAAASPSPGDSQK